MIFLHLHYNHFFSFFFKEWPPFFGDSTVPMTFKSSANAMCLESDILLPFLDILLNHSRKGVFLSAYIAIAVRSPCVVPLLILLMDHLERKICLWRIAVVDIQKYIPKVIKTAIFSSERSYWTCSRIYSLICRYQHSKFFPRWQWHL